MLASTSHVNVKSPDFREQNPRQTVCYPSMSTANHPNWWKGSWLCRTWLSSHSSSLIFWRTWRKHTQRADNMQTPFFFLNHFYLSSQGTGVHRPWGWGALWTIRWDCTETEGAVPAGLCARPRWATTHSAAPFILASIYAYYNTRLTHAWTCADNPRKQLLPHLQDCSTCFFSLSLFFATNFVAILVIFG